MTMFVLIRLACSKCSCNQYTHLKMLILFIYSFNFNFVLIRYYICWLEILATKIEILYQKFKKRKTYYSEDTFLVHFIQI